MKQINLSTLALQEPFSYHSEIKEKLLDLINKTQSENILNQNEYYGDSINRLDWSKNNDFNREWVKYLQPYLQEQFNKFASVLNYDKPVIKKLWFQQYVQNDYHGWHIHGDNYTGVYYLDFPKGSSKTELIDQKDINKKITVNAKEGDIIIFPSFIIHRSPKIKENIKKTIISFNIEMNLIKSSIFSTIDTL